MINQINFRNGSASEDYTGINFYPDEGVIYCYISKSTGPLNAYKGPQKNIEPILITDSMIEIDSSGYSGKVVINGSMFSTDYTNKIVFINNTTSFPPDFLIDVYFRNKNDEYSLYYWGEYSDSDFQPLYPVTYLKFMGASGPFYPKKHPACLDDRPYLRIKKRDKIDNYPLTDDPAYMVGQGRFKIKNRLWALEASEPNLIVRDNTGNSGSAIIYTYKNGQLVTLYTANAYAAQFTDIDEALSPNVFYEETTGIYFITGSFRYFKGSTWRFDGVSIGLCKDGYKIEWTNFKGTLPVKPRYFLYDIDTKRYYFAILYNSVFRTGYLNIENNKVTNITELQSETDIDYYQYLYWVKIGGKYYWGVYYQRKTSTALIMTFYKAFYIVNGVKTERKLQEGEVVEIVEDPTELYDIYSNTSVRLENYKLIKTAEDGTETILFDDSRNLTKPDYSIACNYKSI